MTDKKLFSIIGLLIIVFIGFHIYTEPSFGAPLTFISSPATTTSASDFGFTIGTTTPLSAFGSTTLAIYGSTTIQTPINTLRAFNVLNAASTSIFSIDTLNSRASTSNFVIANLGNTGTECLQITNQGVVSVTGSGCASGLSGGSLNALAYWTSATAISATSSQPLFVGSLNATTSTASIFTGGLISQASSTFSSGIVNLTGGLISAASSTFSSGAFRVEGAATFPGGITVTCTSCITDANVINTITLDNITQITNRAISDTTGTLTVSRGGTGATTLSQDLILIGNGTGAITATSSPTVGWITATSTIASTFAGGVTITCTSCITDANVINTITLDNLTQITTRAIADTTGTLAVARGGTGLTTFGGTNRILYTSTADNLTSSASFIFDGTNFGIGTTTPATLLSAQGTGYVSSSLFVGGVLTSTSTAVLSGGLTLTCTSCITDTNVSDTLTASNLVAGSSVVANAEVDDDITLTNITQITNRAIADTSGTLTVARGGTGLTTFAAGNLVYASSLDTIAGLTVGASSTVLTSDGSLPLWTAQPSFATLATRGLFSLFGNLTGTSTIDFSGGLFRIVASSSLTTLTSGQMGIDTTSGQLRFNDGNTTMVVVATSTLGFNVSSTTLANYGGFGGVSATATIIVQGLWDDITITELVCESQSTTTVANAILQVGDGTASATPIAFCNQNGQTISLSTNNTFTPGEDIFLGFGSATGTVPDKTFPRINYKFDPN